jgi:hypothetical protein
LRVKLLEHGDIFPVNGAAAVVEQTRTRQDKTTGTGGTQVYLLLIERVKLPQGNRVVEILRGIGRDDDQGRQIPGITQGPGRHGNPAGCSNRLARGGIILPLVKVFARKAVGGAHRVDDTAERDDRITLDQ